MADSTLDPDNDPVPDRQLGKGHNTGALGPSDLSDTGSDVVGGTGLAGEEDLLDDRIVAEDSERNTEPGYTDAGADMGDTDLDADSDSGGTGERAAASRDTSQPLNQDIVTDRTVDASEAGLGGGLDEAELAQRKPDRPARGR